MGETCLAGHSIWKDTCQACKSLQAEWNSYLAKTGFEDIEAGPDNSRLQLINLQDFRTTDNFNAQVSYYNWARSRINDGRFDTQKDQLIWEKYAEGVPHRTIGKAIGFDHSWVGRKIKKIEHALINQVVGSVSASHQKLFSII